MRNAAFAPILYSLSCVFFAAGGETALAQAPARVEFTVVYEQGGMIDKPQFWARRLGEAGIRNVKLRLRRATDRPGIETGGTPDRPIYRVTAVIDSRDRLVIDNKRYGRGDVDRLAAWLNALARKGPPGETETEAAGPFDIPKSQFDQIAVDLSRPVGFSTLGKSRRDVLKGLAEEGVFPMPLSKEVLELAGDVKMKAELKDLSLGTARAYTLRTFDMGFTPKLEPQNKYRYKIIALTPDVKTWPVGWASEKQRRELVPKLFEFLNVNVENVPIAEVLGAVSKRLEVPVLYDPVSLKKHKLDPEKEIVSAPNVRTSYVILMRRVLFQAKMESELRVDDAGTPFFWITWWKK